MRDSLLPVEEDAIELVRARTGISRQAGLTLAMLVLIPTAAALTAASWLLQSMARSSNPRGAVLLLAGIGMLLLDAAVVGGAILWWLTRRGGGSRTTLADERGVTVRAGTRIAFLPWPEFDRVSLSDGMLLAWLRSDSLFAAHPVVARMPRRNADVQGNVPLVLGTLVDIPEALRRLKAWLGREVEIDLV